MNGEMGATDGSTRTVSVLIVDDQLPFRAVARTVIGLTGGFDVAGEAETGEDAVHRSTRSAPDLVLMDINLPGINGIEATRRIRAAHPDDAVILLSTYSEADLPADARDCGALAYVHKEDFGPALVRELWDARAPDRRAQSASASVGSGDRFERQLAADPRAGSPGALSTVERAADRAEAVGHVDEAVAAHRVARRVEARRRRRPPRSAARPSHSSTVIVMRAPSPACLPAFCIASRQQK